MGGGVESQSGAGSSVWGRCSEGHRAGVSPGFPMQPLNELVVFSL